MTSSSLKQGAIVFADNVPDEHGRNLKSRRVVVVTPTDEIQPGNTVHTVAITSEINSVPALQAVPLRWHPKGHIQTGLKKKCVAACHWIVPIPLSSLHNVTGNCNSLELEEILVRINDAKDGIGD